MNIPQPIIEFFDKKCALHSKQQTVYRIKWRGSYIVTPSGKSVWTTLGGAKNAFNRFKNSYGFKDMWRKAFPESVIQKEYRRYYGSAVTAPEYYEHVDMTRWSELLHFLQEQKLLEFEKLEKN